jgi:hypothetical protein
LPPKPPLEPLEEPETLVPREPDETEPALRLEVVDELLGTELTLLPFEEELTVLATEVALLVAALTRAVLSAADLLVAATPPPVPPAWPDTAAREACSVLVLAAACWAAVVFGFGLLVDGGGE